jgi:uncharacterized protein Usg
MLGADHARETREVMALSAPAFEPSEYRLTTAEIVYRLPDHPDVLQTFVWQTVDLSPGLPRLHRFLKFWRENIEGELHSVRVGQSRPQRHRPVVIQPVAGTRH